MTNADSTLEIYNGGVEISDVCFWPVGGEIIAENVLTDVNNIRQEILDAELQIEQIRHSTKHNCNNTLTISKKKSKQL